MLSEKFESDPVAFLNSAKGAKPSSNRLPIKDHLFHSRPATALANLNTEVTSLLEQVDLEAIKEVFVLLLGYYFSKVGKLCVTWNTMLEALQDWTTKACGLPKAPLVSDTLLAKMGRMDGHSPVPRAEHGSSEAVSGSSLL